MAKEKINTRFAVVAGIILLAAFSRFISPFNFSPIGAISLFGAAYFSRKVWAFAIPFLAVWLSNLVLDNVIYAQYYDGFQWFSNPFVYLGFGFTVLAGFGLLKKITAARVIGAGFAASIIFFLVSNFGAWLEMAVYPKTFSGLMAAYAAGLPFLKNSLIGNLVYCSVLFGAFEWMKQFYPQLRAVAE